MQAAQVNSNANESTPLLPGAAQENSDTRNAVEKKSNTKKLEVSTWDIITRSTTESAQIATAFFILSMNDFLVMIFMGTKNINYVTAFGEISSTRLIIETPLSLIVNGLNKPVSKLHELYLESLRANNPDQINNRKDQFAVLWQSANILGLATSGLMYAGMRFGIMPALRGLGQPPEIIGIVDDFYHYYALAMPFKMLFGAAQNFCNTTRHTGIPLIASLVGTASLVLSAWQMNKSAPLAAKEIGIAYTIQAATSTLFVYALMLADKEIRSFRLFSKRNPTERGFTYKRRIWEILVNGLSVSAQFTGELAALGTLSFMAGELNKIYLTVQSITQQLVLNIMVPLYNGGMLSAWTIMENAAVAGRTDLYKKYAYIPLAIGSAAAILCSLGFILFPIQSAQLMDPKINSPEYNVVREMLPSFMLIAMSGQFFDNIRNIMSGSLRGLNYNWFPAISGIISYLLGLAVGYILTFRCGYGLNTLALCRTGAVIASAIANLIRLHSAMPSTYPYIPSGDAESGDNSSPRFFPSAEEKPEPTPHSKRRLSLP